MAAPVSNDIAPIGNALIDGLIQGSSWTFSGPHVLTYSLSLNDTPGNQPAWSPALSSAISQALAAWSAVANVTFTETGSGGVFTQSPADLAFALTGNELQQGGAVALGVFPSPQFADGILADLAYDRASYPHPEGDVFLDNGYGGFNYLDAGGYGLATILHEIGHALGLKHPGDDGGSGRPTFAALGISAQDSETYTVMSNNWDSLLTARHDATPMLLDMLAIQHVYGANTSYHTGDDTYSLDFPLNTTKAVREAIWDAGGTDTIDASHYLAGSSGITLDLTPGSVNQFYPLSEFSIAYGVTIENVVGSPYNDTLNGNDANNRIDGGAGSDVMHGGPGDDTYVVDSASDIVNESAGEGTDTVSSSVSYSLAANVENLTLTGTAPNALGNDIANVLTGNAANNSLFGAGGDDVLVYTGGADTLDGGMGFDTAMVMFGHAAASTLTASSFTIAGQTTTLTGIEARAFLEVNHGGTFVPGQAYYQDINGDGRVDLTLENDSLQFWLSDGNASGLDAPSLAFQHGGTSGFIVNQTQFADINGDGHQDALFQGIDNRFWVSASDGTRFGNPVLAAVVTHDDFNTAQVRYADMNGDGKADMMYQGDGNAFWYYQSQGSTFAEGQKVLDLPGTFQAGSAGYGDVDGDGKGDIIYQNPDNDFYLAISGSDWTVA